MIRQHGAGRSKDRSRDKDRARQISVKRLKTRHRITNDKMREMNKLLREEPSTLGLPEILIVASPYFQNTYPPAWSSCSRGFHEATSEDAAFAWSSSSRCCLVVATLGDGIRWFSLVTGRGELCSEAQSARQA